jgi:hypothetical protein
VKNIAEISEPTHRQISNIISDLVKYKLIEGVFLLMEFCTNGDIFFALEKGCINCTVFSNTLFKAEQINVQYTEAECFIM